MYRNLFDNLIFIFFYILLFFHIFYILISNFKNSFKHLVILPFSGEELSLSTCIVFRQHSMVMPIKVRFVVTVISEISIIKKV